MDCEHKDAVYYETPDMWYCPDCKKEWACKKDEYPLSKWETSTDHVLTMTIPLNTYS